jgi:hypothetical protein
MVAFQELLAASGVFPVSARLAGRRLKANLLARQAASASLQDGTFHAVVVPMANAVEELLGDGRVRQR